MKKLNLTKIMQVLFLVIIIGISASASTIKTNSNNITKSNVFEAQITIYVYEGEGCGCTPIEGATIFATGGDGNDTDVTDADGKCIITLPTLGEYRVSIDAKDFTTILFDFNVLDDQMFKFHMQAKKTSSISQLVVQKFIENLLII